MLGLSALSLYLTLSAPAATDAVTNPRDMAAFAVSESAVAVRQAAEGRDIAFHAIENAIAVRDEAAKTRVAALRAGKKESAAAKRVMERADEELETAIERLEVVVGLLSEVEASAASVTGAARQVQEAISERDARDAAARAVKLARTATQALARAVPIVEELKLKWLMPLMGTTTTATTTTTTSTIQPLSLTPAGKR